MSALLDRRCVGITNDHVYAETPDWLIALEACAGLAAGEQPAGEREQTRDLAVVESATSCGLPDPGESGGASNLPDVAGPMIDLIGAGAWEEAGNLAVEASASGGFENRSAETIEVLVSAVSVSVDRREKAERPSAVRVLSRLAASCRVFRSADGRFCAQVPLPYRPGSGFSLDGMTVIPSHAKDACRP